jgi:hypothetical protein
VLRRASVVVALEIIQKESSKQQIVKAIGDVSRKFTTVGIFKTRAGLHRV